MWYPIRVEIKKCSAKKVYLAVRNIELIKELEAKYGDKVVTVKAYVWDVNSIQALAKEVKDVDTVVNHAGIAPLPYHWQGRRERFCPTIGGQCLWLAAHSQRLYRHLGKKQRSPGTVKLYCIY